MKLDINQIGRIESLMGINPMPDDHPGMEDFSAAFGEHTFYLSEEGLVIWEWLEGPETDGLPIVAVILAGWVDEKKSSLTSHQPRITEIILPLAPTTPEAMS